MTMANVALRPAPTANPCQPGIEPCLCSRPDCVVQRNTCASYVVNHRHHRLLVWCFGSETTILFCEYVGHESPSAHDCCAMCFQHYSHKQSDASFSNQITMTKSTKLAHISADSCSSRHQNLREWAKGAWNIRLIQVQASKRATR
jgi:hypothetical protein